MRSTIASTRCTREGSTPYHQLPHGSALLSLPLLSLWLHWFPLPLPLAHYKTNVINDSEDAEDEEEDDQSVTLRVLLHNHDDLGGILASHCQGMYGQWKPWQDALDTIQVSETKSMQEHLTDLGLARLCKGATNWLDVAKKAKCQVRVLSLHRPQHGSPHIVELTWHSAGNNEGAGTDIDVFIAGGDDDNCALLYDVGNKLQILTDGATVQEQMQKSWVVSVNKRWDVAAAAALKEQVTKATATAKVSLLEQRLAQSQAQVERSLTKQAELSSAAAQTDLLKKLLKQRLHQAHNLRIRINTLERELAQARGESDINKLDEQVRHLSRWARETFNHYIDIHCGMDRVPSLGLSFRRWSIFVQRFVHPGISDSWALCVIDTDKDQTYDCSPKVWIITCSAANDEEVDDVVTDYSLWCKEAVVLSRRPDPVIKKQHLKVPHPTPVIAQCLTRLIRELELHSSLRRVEDVCLDESIKPLVWPDMSRYRLKEKSLVDAIGLGVNSAERKCGGIGIGDVDHFAGHGRIGRSQAQF